MKRHESRGQALTLLFESSFGYKNPDEVLELASLAREEKISGFSKELFLGTLENLENIDLIIENHLKGWKKDRLSKVVLSILRLGIFEMIYYKTPVDVSIDEAVLLAKEYATKDDASYINGVLGAIAKNFKEINK